MQQSSSPPETGRYVKIADLGSGVQLARNLQTEELVAIKFIERGDRVNKYVENEILNHRMLRHPHVIEFKEVFLTSEHVCVAMEYASGGLLSTYVQRAVRLKEAEARWFFQQLIIGLDYCHRKVASPGLVLVPRSSPALPGHQDMALMPAARQAGA
jgi:serine/threonine-protein kinase SRK2